MEAGATRRVNTGLTLALGLVTGVLGLVGNSVAAFVARSTGQYAWLAVPVAAVAVAVVTAFATAKTRVVWPEPPDGTTSSGSPPPPVPERRGLRLTTAVLAMVLVFGGGGLAATLGVRYVVGLVTGNEPGVDRLVAPVTTESKGLSLTVGTFEDTRHFTRLTVTVRNDVGNALSLPLFKNCVVIGADGTTLEADSFRSHWTESVAPGSRQTGEIVFGGHLGPEVREASLAFSTVFERGFDGPDSVRVDRLRLRPAG